MRTLLASAALGAAIALSGCITVLDGSAVAHTHSSQRALCGDVGQVTSLVVQRVPINHERFGFPAHVRATGSAARAVARAMCSLPREPAGIRFCPDDWGPTYHLMFLAGSKVVSVDLASPTGCPDVLRNSGGANAFSRLPTARFWSALGVAVGVRGATWATFAGALPG